MRRWAQFWRHTWVGTGAEAMRLRDAIRPPQVVAALEAQAWALAALVAVEAGQKCP